MDTPMLTLPQCWWDQLNATTPGPPGNVQMWYIIKAHGLYMQLCCRSKPVCMWEHV